MFKLYTNHCLVLILFLTIVGCEDKEEEQVQEIITEDGFVVLDEARAALNYRQHCGGCHGQSFESFIERVWSYGNSVNEVQTSIEVGYDQNGMPGYSSVFTSEELADLSNFILSSIEGRSLADIEAENPDLSGAIASEDLDFRIETITNEIDGIPWSVIQLPNGGDFLVTERSGALYRITTDGALTQISGLPDIVARGQGGLLDITLHPDFENNSYIYLSYAKGHPGNADLTTTAVVRAQLQENNLIDAADIFIALPYSYSNGHYGSRVLFDQNGYLYVTVGDRDQRDLAQELDNAFGKVHRIHDDGQIPSNNPFMDNQDAIPSVFSYGIRNPQGLTLHPVTGDIWESEHGPQGGDEVNILGSGNNYGWPAITYGIDYDGSIISAFTEMDGMEQPIHHWTPSIAPAGITFLSSNFYGEWQNDLFVGSLKFEYLHRLRMNGNEVVGQEELLDGVGRMRDVYVGTDGYLYVLVQSPGRLLRIVPVQ